MTLRLTLAVALACACINATAQSRSNTTDDEQLALSLSTSLPGLRTPEGSPARTPGLRNEPDSMPVFELSPTPLSSETIDLTAEHEDLFMRLRSGFSIPNLDNDLVLYHQQWYLNRPDYLRRMVERSRRYMHHIIEELERRGMPTELALLPMVESAYNPLAYSRANASGLWQFIPSTGKNFKLQQNWWVDQRRDVIASTAAALDYLQSIYEMHGDWHLALASYNWGEGAVGRAIAKNRAKGLPTDYQSLTMPPETRNYIPKLQALKNIFGNPELVRQLGLAPLPNRPYFTTIVWPANIDVDVAAKLAEVPVDEFLALNPANNRPVIAADTPLVLPTNKVDTFMSNLDRRQSNDKPLSYWRSYTTRPGEKLETLAPRFGITLESLKAANGIVGRLRPPPGFTLLVPAPDGSGSIEPAAMLAQPRLPAADPTPTSTARSYVARKGDTLASVARRNGMSVAELKKLNRLSSERLPPGTKLTLAAPPEPAARVRTTLAVSKAGSNVTDKRLAAASNSPPAKGKAQTSARNATGKPTAVAAQAAKKPRITRYTVRKGDTLASIARHFKVDADDLMRWNHVSASTLQPGRTLTIQLASND
ncbi:LysM peptidoglycan-binding domain-containing protein [Rhodocyclus tenuis]|uniref:lytic transglycosylase n=1 Tax=Rhodocyclus gracilis TaxID=2929842 RepID=UPI0012989A8C|nr:LysM peptidoglycan-binding domain-containing protein [Rhodocyclus gracilis]MRD73029.1 LysM peptidoglycan-binding domain-containing protein [Rhodocyclus gracilis]